MKDKILEFENEDGDYGIEATKDAIDYLSLVSRKLVGIDADKDKKVSQSESIAAAGAILPGLFGFVGGISEVRKENAKGERSERETEELIDYIINTPFLPDDRERAAEFLKKTMLMLNYNRRYAVFVVDFVKEGKAAA